MKTIIVAPRATEKAYKLSTTQNTYIFDVPLDSNKQEIVAAIQAEHNVTITSIKTAVQSGKAIRYNRGKKRYPGTTHRKDSKKAYVTLAEGNSIRVFDEVEEKKEKK